MTQVGLTEVGYNHPNHPMETTNKTSPSVPTGVLPNTGKREIASTTLLRSQSAKKAAMLRQQRDQVIDETAKGMVPEHRQKPAENPIKPWWPQIKRKLNEGYSVPQIRTMIQSPKIGLDVSVRALKQFIAEHAKAQSATPAK